VPAHLVAAQPHDGRRVRTPAARLTIAAWHNAKIKVADVGGDSLRDVCGSGNRRYAGDGGPCEKDGMQLVSFDLPSGVVYDKAGNLFIADQANQVIRRLGTDGIVKTVAGNCKATPGFGCPLGQGYTGDGGPAIEATLRSAFAQATDPQGKIAIDGQGNLYIADTGNHVVRKVVPGSDGVLGSGDPGEEIITTFAGTGKPGFSGDGGPATSAMLPSRTTWRWDRTAASSSPTLPTTASARCAPTARSPPPPASAAPGRFSGDGGPCLQATLLRPYGVAVSPQGDLVIADTGNNRIRKVIAP
jgi:hypothetical protein